ncbi:MAG: hypothetical protein A2675_01030 [Candidatus Yonathbacteria bacterium RIFCSPHIGHO2_01_FULL_51_10]|uniref:DUF4190 domain-containing protein n=1 Tax=Candidatus Yonathbacteria bacterium RIFCSPHIGHO2_01_FULL_51_10 TaxID=1802723 RepID=A0A1G2S8I6_9BACT|nr:MAG: hypothetical protein A2675_01030 [Candidatus Yonathbacteria bacterium RIFCSPHIGHO2_01_FULL_51_10]
MNKRRFFRMVFGGAAGIAALASPYLASAAIVPCDTNCGFSDLITLAQNVVHFLLFDLAMPLAAIAFVYVGWIFLTEGSNEGSIKKAKSAGLAALIGLIVAFGAWAIVKVVVSVLFDSSQIPVDLSLSQPQYGTIIASYE